MKRDRSLKRWLITVARLTLGGIRNLFRNAWLSIAAMAVMFVALGILFFTVVLNVTTSNAITELSRNLKVSVYLEDDINDEQRFELETALASSPYTADLEYISKDDARARFVENFRDDEALLEGLFLVGDDSLPASYEVSAMSLDDFDRIEAIATEERFEETIESITLGRTDARATIERAASAQAFITSASALAAIIFTVISVLIIFNTIRIAIFTRNEEIRNMKLIGATPWYIRGPFIVEASMYGVISGLLAVLAVYGIIYSIGPNIANQDEFRATFELFTQTSTVLLATIATVVAGIIVGAFSSLLAMRKYLRLKHW
jgi:cell division transport system permease protein